MMDIHQHEKTTKGKLILVSNRLPVHVDIKSDNTIQFRSSAGGLATALNGFHNDHSGSLWVGWPGVIPLEHREEVKNRLLTEYGCYPVFLEADLVEKFYDGFSNNTLWPLFHSFPAYTRYLDAEWEAYKEANEQFGKAILEVASSGDCIWIHDFHIMLLPKILREALPDLVIGFFLHIPFPSYDIYRLMPWGSEITDAVLRADLVGFHTYDYVQNFLAVVRRSLGIDNNLGVIVRDQLVCHVDVFPIGIDFNKFNESTDAPDVQLEIAKIEKRHQDQKVIFAVSRLDYTKGIIESLHAFETLLVTQPQYQKRVVFVLVVVPSRERVKRYASLKKEIDESVGRINSKYGSFEWHPVLYLFQSLTFAELTAYYFCADVGLVIPSRDGMNLVAKEYLATKKDAAGVLVLSEMAGSAKELQEALLVNPNSKRDVVEALDYALTMPLDEQTRRNEPMRSRLEEYDTARWGTTFLNRLDKARDERKELVFRVLDSAIRDELIENWRNARKKLIILDYDGCLVPFNRNLQAALPDRALIDLLERLGSKKDTEVVLLTSRDRGFLERRMGHAQNVTLVAQAGGWSRAAGSSEWQSAITNSSHIAWREHILPLMQMTRDRIPGSDLTDDELTITWDWRRADPDTALTAAKELLDVLIHLTASMPLKVSMTPKSIVIRDGQIGKGTYYNNQLAGDEWDFLLAMGEDFEEVFASLPASAHSIQVGMKLSKAKCNFKSVYEARQLLASLADIKAYSG